MATSSETRGRDRGPCRGTRSALCLLAVVVGIATPSVRVLAGVQATGAGGEIVCRDQRSAETPRVVAESVSDPEATAGDIFDDLEPYEDPDLAGHRAGDLSGGELALVIVFLIIFFPIGVILLILFLVDDDIDL